jgi:hypothetical protein
VKICLEVLQGFLSRHAQELLDPTPVMVTKPLVVNLTHTWLPALNCLLPGTWADPALISAKVTKADNAKVPLSMWNDQTTLIMPHWTAPKLDLMRRLVLRLQYRRLYVEFVSYMRHRYGKDWLSTLLIMRRSTVSASRLF